MDGGELLRVLDAALAGGFRHIDSAQIYRNEAVVGEAIAGSGLPRSEGFITTKVWAENYSSARFAASVDESLVKLRTDYVDLLLLHWPTASPPSPALVGALGAVSATSTAPKCSRPPACQPRPWSPTRSNTTPTLTRASYWTLPEGAVFRSPPTAAWRSVECSPTAFWRRSPGAIAGASLKSCSVGSFQQDGVVALSRTTNIARVSENAAVFDFELSAEEMAAIHALATPGSRIVDPPGLAPTWDPSAIGRGS
jgi:hypothetical protein